MTFNPVMALGTQLFIYLLESNSIFEDKRVDIFSVDELNKEGFKAFLTTSFIY